LAFTSEELQQPPSAAALSESLRGVGYSVETALADLVDNSISAEARNVWISIGSVTGVARVAVVDDGSGMSREVVLQAMRPGSRSPLETRDAQDLGRFGLGLKTASFSHCRCLSVATREANSAVYSLRWDLDLVASTDRWQLVEGLDPDLAQELDVIRRLPPERGATLVMWSHVDQVPQLTGTQRQRAELLSRIRGHLGMVFHRFLEEKRLTIHLGLDPDPLANGAITPWNPFVPDRSHLLPGEMVRVGGIWCSFKGYVLPHRDRCTEQEWEEAAGPGGWVAQQGFYVYRNQRMLVDGDWLRLNRGWRKDELYKLARIQLDFDSHLDSHWKIDIKKSRATPPKELKDKLRDLAMRVRQESERVFAHRGSRRRRASYAGPTNDVVPVWQVSSSTDSLRFRINRDHPLVRCALEDSSRTEGVLQLLEKHVPAARIWLEMNRQADITHREESFTEAEARGAIGDLFAYLVESCDFSLPQARERILDTEPFDQHSDVVDAVLAELGVKQE